MRVELKAVVVYYDSGHKYVDVIVEVDGSELFDQNTVGIDVKVSPGKIWQFLADKYDVKPGHIIWPEHIKKKDF